MAQAILTLIPQLFQIVADNTTGTISIQVYNSSTSSWTTIWSCSLSSIAVDVAQSVSSLTVSGSASVGTTLGVGGLATLSQGAHDATLATASVGTTATTTSTTAVSTGIGLSIIPGNTQVLLEGHAIVSNNTAGDGAIVYVYRSTAGIPAAGSAPATGDTAVFNSGAFLSSAANQQQSVAIHALDTGLTSGAKYYYYFGLAAVTGGTASLVGGTNTSVLVARTA